MFSSCCLFSQSSLEVVKIANTTLSEVLLGRCFFPIIMLEEYLQ
jgi:hypothetical protein